MASRGFQVIAVALSAVTALSGCATPVSYAPRPLHAAQTVSAARGAGTLSERDADGALYVAPTFRAQPSSVPTFTIAYANTSDHAVAFGPAQVRASFRGVPVALYTREEKAAERSAGDIAGQIAVVLLGAVAVAAALYGLARPTVSVVDTGVGRVRVSDATDGFVTAVVAGSLAEAGFRELEDSAQTRSAAAGAILTARIVPPERLATGQLILKGCCDRAVRDGDTVRFEVDVDGRALRFEFVRTAAGDWLPVADDPTAAVAASPPPQVPEFAAPARARPHVAALRGLPGGQDAYSAERAALAQACPAAPAALLVDKGPGYETYSVPCADGRVLAIRCDFGACRLLVAR